MMILGRSTYLRQARSFSRNARLFLLSQVVAGLGSGIFGVLFNLYLVRLGHHEDFIGQVAGLSTLLTGLVAFPAGLLADRIGRRSSLVVGATIVPLAFLLQVLLDDPQAILILGMVGGAGVAFIMISMSPFMAENSSQGERAYLFSANFALITLSAMVGSFLGGWLPGVCAGLVGQTLDTPLPYRLALLVGVALFGISAIPFYLLRNERRQNALEEVALPDVSMEDADVRKRMLAFAVVNVLVGIGGGLILPFFNVFFLTRFNQPAETVGVIFGVSQALVGVSTLLSPALVRRMDKVTLIAGGHFAVLPFLLVLAMTNNVWIATAAYWGRNVGINMINPIWGAFSMEMVPARLRATLSGMNNTAWNITWAMSSTAGGSLILSLGYSKVFLMAAFFYALAGAMWLLGFRRYRRM